MLKYQFYTYCVIYFASKYLLVRFLVHPGAECSPEWLEAGPAFGFGPHAALLNLPPLLHPLWAALKKNNNKSVYIPTSIQVQQSNQFSFRFDSFTLDVMLT